MEETESLDDTSEDEVKRQIERHKEWGQQFDKWLINAAKRNLVIEILFDREYPGVTHDGNIINCTPKRIDRFNIQVVVDKVEVWLNKDYIIGCKSGKQPSKTTNDD